MKKNLYLFVGLLFCIISKAFAQNDMLTVNVGEAGTLPTLVTEAQKYTTPSIRVTGALNGTDVKFLRDMAEVDSENKETNGILTYVDLSGATIHSGGETYLSYFSHDTWKDVKCDTEDNVFPADFFHGTSVSTVLMPNTIVKIGDNAFQNCTYLTSVEIPASVTELGNNAFSGSGLSTVELPSTITKIGSYCFWGCANMVTVDFKASLTELPEGVFSQTSIAEFKIPSSVTSIKTAAFQFCYSLASVTGGENITKIDSYAFNQCKVLADVILPEGLESIGLQAFSNCGSLKTFNIPAKVSYIGKSCFMNCPSLSEITVDEANKNYCSSDGVLYTADGKSLVCCPAGKTGNVETLASLEKIEDSAFDNCAGMTSVVLNENLKTVGNDAFNFCGGLEKITCYAVEPPAIGWSGAFFRVPSSCVLRVMPGSEEKYATANGWKDFKNIETISQDDMLTINVREAGTLPTLVTEAQKYTTPSIRVTGALNGTDVKFLRDMAEVDSENKETNGILTYVDLSGATIHSGGETYLSYFSHDTWKDVKCDTEDNVFPADFFHGTSVSTVLMPNTIVKIGDNAFQNCTYLTSVEIPASVTELGNNAFSGSGLSTVELPSTITKIGSYCFWGCANMVTVDFKASLTELPEGVFSQTSIAEFKIPSSVTSIKTAAFQFCYSLASVTGGENITKIDSYAFNQCKVLADVILPEGLESIGLQAFSNCGSLKTFNIPAKVSYIGKSCFMNCPSLSEITVDEANKNYCSSDGVLYTADGKSLVCCPAGKTGNVETLASLEKIEDSAFDNCAGMTSVVLNENLKTVGNDAFNFCGGLEKITCYAVEPPAIGWSGAFFRVPSSCVLRVMPGSEEKYATANGWKDFKNIETIEVTAVDGVDTVEDGVLGCYSMDGIRLSGLHNGMNIIRTKGGKTIKVMVP